MLEAKQAEVYFEIIDAPSPANPDVIVKLGFRQDGFSRHARLGLATAIAQYYGIVRNGVLLASHAFQGLNRPLLHNGDMDADKRVIVYAWRPPWDYEWEGDPWNGRPVRRVPPPNRVFVVLVREEPASDFGIIGSIEKWNWVMEDSDLAEAPVEWKVRYGKKLWSRTNDERGIG